MFSVVSEWINNSSDHPIAILGGYGAGKSSFAKKLVSYQAKIALRDPSARQPILIELGDCTRFSKLEGLLGAKFTHDYPIQSFNAYTFLKLNEAGRMLIVLDGFDEMKHAMTWRDFRRQIQTLNQLNCGKAKVVLLGRPSAFTSNDEHLHVLRGIKKNGDLLRKLPDWPMFLEFEVSPFDTTQRRFFIERYLRYKTQSQNLPNWEKWLSTRAEEVNRLADAESEVFSKPVHSKILVDLATDPTVNLSRFASGVSRWVLYEIFFESLHEREGSKEARGELSQATRSNFTRNLAYWLWTARDGSTSFQYEDLPYVLLAQVGVDTSDENEDVKRELLIGSFLEKKSGDTFYFGHRSFAEFLVAEKMVREPPDARDQPQYSLLFQDGVRLFLEEYPHKASLSAWAKTLSLARGNIRVEYVNFLINCCGGMEQFRGKMALNKPFYNTLSAFSDNINLNKKTIDSLFSVMKMPENENFLMAYSTSMLNYSRLHKSVYNHAEYLDHLCAVVLERLFKKLEWNSESRRGIVPSEYEDARTLAACMIKKASRVHGQTYIALDMEKYSKYVDEIEDNIQFKLTYYRGQILHFGNTKEPIKLSAIGNLIDQSVYKKLTEYFKWHDDLSGIFVRATKDETTNTKNSNRGRGALRQTRSGQTRIS